MQDSFPTAFGDTLANAEGYLVFSGEVGRIVIPGLKDKVTVSEEVRNPNAKVRVFPAGYGPVAVPHKVNNLVEGNLTIAGGDKSHRGGDTTANLVIFIEIVHINNF